jgi:hypothetical protein
MSYTTNIPNATQSPSLFPGQATTNWTRLKTLINADHQFNDSAASTDGYHKIVRWVNQSGALYDNTPTPIAGVGQLYTKSVTTSAGTSEQLCYHQGTGATASNENCLSLLPIRAYANFNGRITNGVATLNSSFNITSITRTAAGLYTVVFPTVMPSANYIITINGQPPSAGVLVGSIRSGGFATNNIIINFAQISVAGGVDPSIACFAIYGG